MKDQNFTRMKQHDWCNSLTQNNKKMQNFIDRSTRIRIKTSGSCRPLPEQHVDRLAGFPSQSKQAGWWNWLEAQLRSTKSGKKSVLIFSFYHQIYLNRSQTILNICEVERWYLVAVGDGAGSHLAAKMWKRKKWFDEEKDKGQGEAPGWVCIVRFPASLDDSRVEGRWEKLRWWRRSASLSPLLPVVQMELVNIRSIAGRRGLRRKWWGGCHRR